MSDRKKMAIALVAAAAMALASAAIILACTQAQDRAARADPWPGGEPSDHEAGQEGGAERGDDDFPEVDWGYWQSVNPDIIGWITVPGTDVNHPVVQASEEEPYYYLAHDVYGQWNPWGCPYLDAACTGGLLASPNAVVYGHHMDDGTMFAPLAGYSDAGWAAAHREVLLQTPDARAVARVFAADIVDAGVEVKVTEFESDAQRSLWLASIVNDASVVLDRRPAAESVVTLCTCSYSYWDDERTLAYCQVG